MQGCNSITVDFPHISKQQEQLQQKEGLRSKDTVVSTHKMDTHFLNPKVVGTFTYSAFLTASGKRD